MLESIRGTEVLELLVVNGLDVDSKIVLPIEDTIAVWLRTGKARLLCRVGVHGVEVGFESGCVLEPLTALGADGRVVFLSVCHELLVGCKSQRLCRYRNRLARLGLYSFGVGARRHAEHAEMLLRLSA